ncbi:hypothetical protein [Parvibaculum sp.]|uniref:hypothetical protein n=1 Tax=Parvibaculum sp. TaxID=2024848 RepID=UPI000C8D3FBF|nr:hypothetical protein [Parvibaculum sp.]MAB13387.1 hypothetical protein [Parvibaculum sp.]
MGEVVRFPGDLITEHDKRRLMDAAEASPFDLSFRNNENDEPVPYLTRCGEMRPQWRLRKAGCGWEAVVLTGDDAGQVGGRGRNAEELLRALMSPRMQD